MSSLPAPPPSPPSPPSTHGSGVPVPLQVPGHHARVHRRHDPEHGNTKKKTSTQEKGRGEEDQGSGTGLIDCLDVLLLVHV